MTATDSHRKDTTMTTDTDEDITETLGPKCPDCGWRRGRHRPGGEFTVACSQMRDRGASAVEYGLMVAAIAAVIVAVVFGLGSIVRGTFQQTCDTIAAETPVEGDCGAPAVP